MRLLKKILVALLSAFLLLLTIIIVLFMFPGIVDNGGKNALGKAQYVGAEHYRLTDFLSSTQGVANDGEYFYCTGTVKFLSYSGLTKIDMKTGEVVLKKTKYFPEELVSQGFDHYGGCSYYNGNLYVALEDNASSKPSIAIFSADTLEFTGKYHVLDGTIQPNGNFPWLAVDGENGVIYTSTFNDCDFVNVLDINNFTLIKKINLDTTLSRTQGAEYHDGALYISCDDGKDYKNIYRADLSTGKVENILKREKGINYVEAEDLTLLPEKDGLHIYQIDVIYPFGIALREYIL